MRAECQIIYNSESTWCFSIAVRHCVPITKERPPVVPIPYPAKDRSAVFKTPWGSFLHKRFSWKKRYPVSIKKQLLCWREGPKKSLQPFPKEQDFPFECREPPFKERPVSFSSLQTQTEARANQIFFHVMNCCWTNICKKTIKRS